MALALAPLLLSVAAAKPATPPDGQPRVFLLDASYLARTRERVREGDPTLLPALRALEREAKAALKEKPFAVVNKTVTPPSGDRHDYMSLAPYFWPNPATSNGLPYIRHDGKANPAIGRIPNHRDILQMPDTVETLALAYYFTTNETYAGKATQLLRAWFLDPTTRMNPNLEYAQAVPGLNTGRGTGIIESRNLTRVVDAVGLLAGSKSWTKQDDEGLKQWFADFLDWMQQGKHGRDEAAARNNHGTYYDIQVSSFALFLGQTNLARQILQDARQKRIAVQIEPDGRQPLELARTKAWSYSVANLSGLMSLAQLGECIGVDLWNYQTRDGRSLCKALDFLTPFATGEKRWPYQQLGGWSARGYGTLVRRAALRFPERYGESARRQSREAADSKSILLSPPLAAAKANLN